MEPRYRPNPFLLRVAEDAIEPRPHSEDAVGGYEWSGLAGESEASHMAPLVRAYLDRHPLNVPESVVLQLQALALRHAACHRARSAAVTEMLDAFERHSIEAILLKGAALAWMIYPSPALRPMSDVDVLVPRAAADSAQRVLRGLRYQADPGPRRFGRHAHHLPPAIRTSGGVTLTIEVHVDALPRDVPSSIAFDNLSDPPQALLLERATAFTFGHIDNLRHLAHHLLRPSPGGHIRLIGVIDLLRYATVFHGAIDWKRLEDRHPWVLNVLRCLHYVTPLPSPLGDLIPPATALPKDAGATIRPFRDVLSTRRHGRAVLRELFHAPDWWMHAYYNVRPGSSLTWVRLFRHPWEVTRWLGLRLSGF